jgi:D-alanyl-D-alanine carboxypeptidase (penicillin-binding protein 5/6)
VLAALLVAAAPAPGRTVSLASRPALAAPAAIVVEPSSGDVAYAKAADRRRRMASTTKLMTVLLTLEREPLAARLPAVRYAAQPAESVVGLRAGERLTVADLLRATMLASANDAAATLAHGVAGSNARFVALMNQRARRLGLTHTHYANPVGLDEPGNYSTPRDLATLALAVRRNAFARAVMNRPAAVLRSGDRVRRVANRNTLVRDVGWISGVKTGHTQQAGYILVGSGRRHGVELVSVVMGAPTEGARNVDTLVLLNYGFTRYRRVTAATPSRVAATVPVRDQDTDAQLVPARTVRVVVRRGQRVTTVTRGVPASLEGPLGRGETVGTLVVRRGGRAVATVPLVTRTAIARASVWQRNTWLGPAIAVGAFVAIAAALASSLSGAIRRRQRRRRRARNEIA